MSYISFYRKWRPQSFSEVVGQEHIVKTLQNAISKNMWVHGYMFCGTKGTGKTSIARIFSKAINCAHGPGIEPCNKCDNCISITAGSNVDLIEIDGASNNGVDDIRILREKVTSLPFILRKKIYIIDEVHMLSKNAFNALLKTLEEPPEHVIFIMATTEPEKVIPTIMSRCQRFDFKPISVDKIKNRLMDIASAEKIDITDSAASMVAKYSGGSLRDADGILEQLSSFGDKDKAITVDEVSSMLGLIDLEMLFELTNIILEKNISQGLLFVSRLFSTSFSLNAFVSEFLEHLYSLYVIKNYENPADILDMPDDFKENYFNQAGLFTQGQLESLIELFTGLLTQIKESENPKTFFKAAVIKALNIAALKTAKNVAGIKTDTASPDKVTAKSAVDDAPSRETAGVLPDKTDAKQSVEKTSANAAAGTTPANKTVETVPDKVEAKQSDEKAPYKEALIEVALKKESEEFKEPNSVQDKNIYSQNKITTPPAKDNSLADKSSSAAWSNVMGNPVEELPEAISQDFKKTSGDFSHLILEIWVTLLIKTKEKSVPLQAILKEVKRFYIRGNKIVFSLEPKNHFHKDELNKLQNRELIQELLKALTGEKFEITFDFISNENISESIDLSHPDRKIRAAGNLPPEHKEITGLGAELMNSRTPEIGSGKNTAALQDNPDGKTEISGGTPENSSGSQNRSKSINIKDTVNTNKQQNLAEQSDAGEQKDLNETGSISSNGSSDVYGYFEGKFNVKEN